MEGLAAGLRTAADADASAISRLVNQAYAVESFFVEGDRTNSDDVRAHMRRGVFLVWAPDGPIAGCIHVELRDRTGHFGMLAVDPNHQHEGIGRRLIEAAETRARRSRCTEMEIAVVNLRTGLLTFYERLGYHVVGTAPYVHRPVTQICHFLILRKPL